MENPFITTGYAGKEYFCDREKETQEILSLLLNGNNIALISPRRVGKTDLLRHCLEQPILKDKYYTFIIDIYPTRTLSDFVSSLGKVVLDELKSKGKRAWDNFLSVVSSLKSCISYDSAGIPSFSLSLGEVSNPETTLGEIFYYLQNADKKCIVIIDEFQQISRYKDKNIEALLRTHIQYCSNAKFVFSGSQRSLMGQIFTSPTRPFYQSVTIFNLNKIPKEKYITFCIENFKKNNKIVTEELVNNLYDKFDGITFYMQKVMNILYMQTNKGDTCGVEKLNDAINYIVSFTSNTYEDLLYQLPDKQKQVLLALSLEGKAKNITSGIFAKRYGLVSPSSIKSAVNGLVEKDLVTVDKNIYQVYDKFFEIWLRRHLL